jgi:hypothetical protein
MHGFESEFTLHVVYKSQTPYGNCFRPAIIPRRRLGLKRLLDPLPVCSLNDRYLNVLNGATRLNVLNNWNGLQYSIARTMLNQ